MTRSLSVRAIIIHEGKLLCVKLKEYHGAIRGNFWCLPGGGVDEGEAAIPALKREIMEELGVMPQIGQLLYVHQFQANDKDILELFFHVINARDFLNVDLSQTSHGDTEIAEVAFVDPASTNILPKFLTSQAIDSSRPTQIFSYT